MPSQLVRYRDALVELDFARKVLPENVKKLIASMVSHGYTEIWAVTELASAGAFFMESGAQPKTKAPRMNPPVTLAQASLFPTIRRPQSMGELEAIVKDSKGEHASLALVALWLMDMYKKGHKKFWSVKHICSSIPCATDKMVRTKLDEVEKLLPEGYWIRKAPGHGIKAATQIELKLHPPKKRRKRGK